MSTAIIERIKKEIESLKDDTTFEEVGVVVTVGDGVAEIEGIRGARMMEMVLFDDGEGKSLKEAMQYTDALYGLILNLEEETVKVVILGDTARVSEGMQVKRTGKLLSIPVGEEIVGRVVTPLGEVLDGKGAFKMERDMAIERVAYGVMDRSAVNEPIHTGIKAIDSMIPIGRGQRELIIGDRATGKTTVAIDTIINQKFEPVETRPICIYVAIGQKESKTARIVRELEEHGAMEYTIVVSTSAADPSPLQFLAPFAGAAIGEFFMEKGKDALIVYDDLSKHAVAYRQMSLLLRRPPGREAYPGDIFYLHSRLLERAAKLSKELGGGSLTALPIIETQEGDVSAYIPTNVISITDGQIFLETDLFNKGIRPALNVGISVSRVGSSAQTKAMKKVSGKIRIELAQFRELEAFMQFAGDLDQDTKNSIDSGRRYTELLKQDQHVTFPFFKQVVSIFAANNGLFNGSEVANVRAIENDFLSMIERDKKEVFESIESERALTDEVASELTKMIAEFKNTQVHYYA
ncbi:MAG: F0F1 ATP synthase subunit alpha [Candidatus Pacebacteria bacterium]|nr:F0F1 ATP synthase subunit alpha [Candidatus Paceibacterota bacterium]MCF7857035.1 F0F1 ATP synthase subunit alpha [Candidatus Paceibacterota bacterium]